MTDAATPASTKPSDLPSEEHILKRIEEYAETNPGDRKWEVPDEKAAADLLVVIAAQVRRASRTVKEEAARRPYRRAEAEYRRAAANGRAMEYIRGMTEETQLVIYGLQIVCPPVIIQ